MTIGRADEKKCLVLLMCAMILFFSIPHWEKLNGGLSHPQNSFLDSCNFS